jgi:hypothetical protein
MRLTGPLAALAMLALSACGETPPATGLSVSEADPCGAQGLQDRIGQDMGAFAAITFDSAKTRFINFGDAVTMDYNPERLNIEFGRDEKVSRIYCG